MKRLLIIFFFLRTLLNAQAINNAPDTVSVIPGKEYAAGALHRFFFGDHWRKVWITPVDVPVINLQTFAGGLTPYERGGGFQTKSLRFKAHDGRIYKFRSLNKDPQKLLAPELQESVVASILKDQISSAHPFACFVAAPLLNEVGILNAAPLLIILPDSPLLGEYRNDFGGVLGTIEEHPDVSDNDTIGFGGAQKIKSTFKLLDAMREDHNNIVSGEEFLKARLMDIWLGDWDRHVDQWRWAGYKHSKRTIWYPIPRDRDQVFAKFDGILPWVAENAVPQLEGFRDYYPEIEDLTWSGRYLDRRFLSSVTRAKWDSVTQFLVNKLTDDVIRKAVTHLPQRIYDISGAEIIEKLIIRRDKLKDASNEYYDLIFESVNIYGSHKDEYVEVNRKNDDEVELTVFKRNKNSGVKEGPPLFHRIFNRGETSEINIDLEGGDDYAELSGEVNSSITIRVVGSKGKDILVDRSRVRGYFLSTIPFISSAENQTIFFDDGKRSEIIKGPGTTIITDKYPEPKNDTERYEPKLRDWGYDWKFKPLFNYSSDQGLLLGGGPVLYNFRFRTDPYLYRMHLLFGYTYKLRSYVLDFRGDFYRVIPGTKVTLQLRKSELAILNFYGKGNQTKLDKSLERNGYYDSQREDYIISSDVQFSPGEFFSVSMGASVKYSETKMNTNTLIETIKPYGIEKQTYPMLNADLIYDTRDHLTVPMKGLFFILHNSYVPRLIDNKNDYNKTSLESRYYIPSNFLSQSVFAMRARGEKLWGTYPFYEAAYIGGANSLRGFDRERFSGDASVELNAELRSYLFSFAFLVPCHFGFTLSAESGRVFVSGEQSKLWHTGIGGGIWLSLINRDLLFSLSYVKSSEDFGIYSQTGFSF